MSEAGFKQTQKEFAEHIRAGKTTPEFAEKFANLESRRMKIYRELFYNNIENFIASGFPVLRSITSEERWHAMVRDFVHFHQSETPYFLEISQEFLRYLQEERHKHSHSHDDPVFMLELAHYEWVELALDISTEEIPGAVAHALSDKTELLDQPLQVSPLCWSLSYQFPVHRISESYQPESPSEQPTFLLAYRNRKDEVGFMEVNAATVRLLQLLGSGVHTGEGSGSGITGSEALNALFNEMSPGADEEQRNQFYQFGLDLLVDLYTKDIVATQ